MPSTLHESLVQLFRDCPRLTVELLCTAAGTEVTPDGRLRATSEDFTNLRAPSYRADAVILIEDAAGQVCRGLILEVQRRRDLRKRMTWPVYVTNLRAALGVPVTLVVVAPSRALARWCATPIVLDNMGNIYRPPVLGPGAVPAITDPVAARAFPELAVLSAVMHGHQPDAEHIGLAALAGCETLDSDLAGLYADVVLASLSKGPRRNKLAKIVVETPGWQGARRANTPGIQPTSDAASPDGSAARRPSYFEAGLKSFPTNPPAAVFGMTVAL